MSDVDKALKLCADVIDDCKNNNGTCVIRQNTIEAIKQALQSQSDQSKVIRDFADNE